MGLLRRPWLLVIITVFLSMTTSAIIELERQNYSIGDEVTINITVPGYFLEISSAGNVFYSGDYNEVMYFYPEQLGIYEVSLSANDSLEESATFNVVNASASLNLTSGASLPSFHLEKTEFVIGEMVRLVNDGSGDFGLIKIYYSAGGVMRRYLGDSHIIEFVPSALGEQELLVYDSSGNLLDNHRFVVVGDASPQIDNVPALSMKAGSHILRGGRGLSARLFDRVGNEISGMPIGRMDLEVRPSGAVNNIWFYNLTSGLDLGVEDVPLEAPALDSIRLSRSVLKSYAIDPTAMNFSYGAVTSIALGTELWKCKEWIFSNQTCMGNWTKIMDLVPGQNYTFNLTPEDPGFTETSPTNGTADFANVVNVANANYNNGNLTNLGSDDGGYWATGRSNGGGQQLDPVGYFNLTYNLSNINLSSPNQIAQLNFSIHYCHTSDVTAPSTCAALLGGTTIEQSLVQIFNYTSNDWVTIGTMPARGGVEGVNNYTVNSGFTDFINSLNLVTVRYFVNITITTNGVDAALAVDYAPLKVTHDKVAPSINFSSPTVQSGTIVSVNYTVVNVTANDTGLRNITIYIYNSSGLFRNYSANLGSSPSNLTVNVTGLKEGFYYLNATAFDNYTNFNFTETRNFTVSLDTPVVQFVNITETSGTILSRNYVRVNVTYTDSSFKNLTIFLYDSTGELVRSNFTLNSTNLYINFTGLADSLYYFNATGYDLVGNRNSTPTRNVTVDSSPPTITFETPTDGPYTPRSYVQVNASTLDPSAVNISVYLFNASGSLLGSNFVVGRSAFINVTGLGEGIYFYNSTACDAGDGCSISQKGNVTVDLTFPIISYQVPTEIDESILDRDYVRVNVTASDTNMGNITIRIYRLGVLVRSNVSSVSPFFWNITGLSRGIHYFNATVCDLAGNCQSTSTRRVNIDVSVNVTFLSSVFDILEPGTRRAMLAYQENGANIPRYRFWNGSEFGSELQANDIGAQAEWISMRSSTLRDEYIMVAADSSDDIAIQMYSYINSTTACWHSGSKVCGTLWEIENSSTAQNRQKQDVGYEMLSGEAMVVYIDASTTPDVVRYVTWNGSTWTSETTVPQTRLTGNMEAIKLVERPESNELALLMTDTNDDGSVLIWNGTDWGCEPGAALHTALGTTAYQTADLAYEQLSGDLLVALTDQTLSEFYFTTKQAGSCVYNTNPTSVMTIGAPDVISVGEQPGSDYAIVIMRDNGANDIEGIVWNGTDMINISGADASAIAEASPNLMIAAGWPRYGDTGILMYADSTNLPALDYMTYNKTAGTWLGGITGLHTTGTGGITNFSASERNYVMRSFMDEDKLFAFIQDDANDLWAKYFVQSSQIWLDADGGTALETESIAATLESNSFDFGWSRFQKTYPSIQFVSPTDTSGIYVPRDYITINVTSSDYNFLVLNITLYNSTGGLVRHSNTNETSLYINTTGLSDGIYYFNATACDSVANCNRTETRNVTLDNLAPVSRLDVPHNNSVIIAASVGNSLVVNATVNESIRLDTVTFLYRYNSTSAWNPICNDSDRTAPFQCTWDLSSLVTGYSYEVRVFANDSAGNLGANDTHFNITIIVGGVNVTSVLVDDIVDVPTNEIDLSAGQFKAVYCNVSVTDPSGYANILGVNATLHSVQVAYGANSNPLNHYNTSCGFISGSGTTAQYSCNFSMAYYAVNSTWNCTAVARNSFSYSNRSDNTTVNQLFALNISTTDIAYNNLAPSVQSNEVGVNISNMGNVPINISVFGFGGDNQTMGNNLALLCSINNVSVANHRFNTVSSTYTTKRNLSSSPVDIGLTLPSQINTTEIKNSTFWQLEVSPNTYTYGQCNGSVVFMAQSP